MRQSSNEEMFTKPRGKFFKLFQRCSDKIICNSINAKKMCEKHYPGFSHKLTVIDNLIVLPELEATYEPKRNGKLKIVVAASYHELRMWMGLLKQLIYLMREIKPKSK
jgi:hypothetical protein